MTETRDRGPSDEALVERILERGDERAFRIFYRRHSPPVYRFVLRLVGQDELEGEEVIQETWYRTAVALHTFEWRSRF